MGKLDGKVVIITGAGRGIGQGIALGFAQEGAQIVCAARTQSQIDATVTQIHELGASAIALQTDVTSAESVSAMYEKTLASYGKVDIVIANAGGTISHDPVETDVIEDFVGTIQLNLIGAYYTAKFAIPYLKEKGGQIIMMGSGLGHRAGGKGYAAYSTAKAGLWMFTRALAAELREYPICVNELIPGLVQVVEDDTPPSADSPLSLEWYKKPADVVPLALFLATQPFTGPSGQSFSLMRRDSQ